MKKNQKTIILLGALLFAAATLCLSCANLNEYRRRVADIRITMADFSNIPDGTYYGEYDAILVGAKVGVTVKNGKITAIDMLEHKNDRGAAANRIPGDIVREQTLLVDTVSGATNSSRVIQKAVQNALESASR